MDPKELPKDDPEWDQEHKCWLCGKVGKGLMRTQPQAPDYQAWWFHKDCYWKLQDILY